MANRWNSALPVADVARKIIRKYGGDDDKPGTLNHLINAPVYYVFCDEMESVGGSKKMGTARKIPPRELYWIHNFARANPEVLQASTGDTGDTINGAFLITIHAGTWTRLSDLQKMALVHHELLHCEVDETDQGPKLTMRPHDLEEFREVVAIYGYWTDGIEDFAKAAQAGQASLFDPAQRLQEWADETNSSVTIEAGGASATIVPEHEKSLLAKLKDADDNIRGACILGESKGHLTTAMLQRALSIGFQRADSIMEALSLASLVSVKRGLEPRTYLGTDLEKDVAKVYEAIEAEAKRERGAA